MFKDTSNFSFAQDMTIEKNEIGCESKHLIQLAQDTLNWLALVNTENFQVP